MKAVLSLLAMFWLGGGAVAQEAIALAIDGWRAETRDGITYYRCASQICAAGSVVSYKAQPHRATIYDSGFREAPSRSCRTEQGIGAHPRRAHFRREAAYRRGRARHAGQPRGRLGRQHHDLHDRSAADRPRQELQPRERLAQARMDREQFRRLPALACRDCRHEGTLKDLAHACPRWRAVRRSATMLLNNSGGSDAPPLDRNTDGSDRNARIRK